MEGGGVGSMSGQSPGTRRSCTCGWQDRPGAHEPGLHMWPVKRRCLVLKQTYQCQATRKGSQVRSLVLGQIDLVPWLNHGGDSILSRSGACNVVHVGTAVQWAYSVSGHGIFGDNRKVHCACGLIYSLRKRATEHCKCKGSQRMQHTAGPFGQNCLLST